MCTLRAKLGWPLTAAATLSRVRGTGASACFEHAPVYDHVPILEVFKAVGGRFGSASVYSQFALAVSRSCGPFWNLKILIWRLWNTRNFGLLQMVRPLYILSPIRCSHRSACGMQQSYRMHCYAECVWPLCQPRVTEVPSVALLNRGLSRSPWRRRRCPKRTNEP